MLSALLVVPAAASCRRRGRDAFLTYYSESGFSLRYPAAWQRGEAAQGGVRYSYLVAPLVNATRTTGVSLTLLAETSPLESYAERFLAGQKVTAAREEERQGARGRSWDFASPDGASRGRLLLVAAEGRVVGLLAQGAASEFEAHAAALEEIGRSFRLERPDRYPVHDWAKFGVRLGVPESWKETRRFSGGQTMLLQFTSPALALLHDETLHAALSVTLEPAPPGGLAEYYAATRRKLGDNYRVTSHEPFRGGFVDVMRIETPVAITVIERYYFADGPRACSLSFEARDDVFPLVDRWNDSIASTLRFASGPVR